LFLRARAPQAQLNVTTLRLKQKSAEFLHTFTPQARRTHARAHE
jgi:hypothetical protein